MKRILIIEDDPSILRGLTEAFHAEHYEVATRSSGSEGLKAARQRPWDLIVLDVMLPDVNGFDVCRTLRGEELQTPILMLTGRGEETDKVLGLELGADDYLTKPFSLKELLARVKALLRRQASVRPDIAECTFGDVHVDFTRQEARKGKKALKLTSREFALLRYFVSHEAEVVKRSTLLDEVWGYESTPTTRTVDNFILNLRKKIETDPSKPKHIRTVHTSGYKFVR